VALHLNEDEIFRDFLDEMFEKSIVGDNKNLDLLFE